MYLKDGNDVVLRLTQEEYEVLLIALGYAAGEAHSQNHTLFRALIKLTNSLNEGNPSFTPQEVPELFKEK